MFDYLFYYKNNPDLQKLGCDEKIMYEHYLKFGKNEGRLCNNGYVFNHINYYNNYSDIRDNVGSNPLKLYEHYINYGTKENRTYRPRTVNIHKSNYIAIMAAFVKSENDFNKIKDTILKISSHVDKIIVVYSLNNSNFKNNFVKTISSLCDLVEVENSTKLVDFHKWYKVLILVNNISKYDYVVLLNDSFVLTRQISDFFETHDTSADIYGIMESYEGRHHLQSYLRIFTRKAITNFVNLYKKTWLSVNTVDDAINLYEIGICDNHVVNSLYKIPTTFKKNPSIDSVFLCEYVKSLNFPVIKIKALYKFFSKQFNVEVNVTKCIAGINEKKVCYNVEYQIYYPVYNMLPGYMLNWFPEKIILTKN